MTAADLRFADSVRALAGWNQTPADWERFLSVEPNGCFIAEWKGAPAGTATCTSYGLDVGWVGMLLVHPERRRCGLGSALLKHCLDYFDQRGMRCVKLDATPLGQPLYEHHGFVPEQSLTRWETDGLDLSPTAASTELAPWAESDLDDCVALDEEAFGLNRRTLVTALSRCCAHAVTYQSGPLGCLGYGMLRNGTRAQYLGPVSARSVELGTMIVRYLLRLACERPVFWDVLDQNGPAMALAQELGFRRQRSLLRMCRGENPGAGKPGLQFAIVDPAVG